MLNTEENKKALTKSKISISLTVCKKKKKTIKQSKPKKHTESET